MWTLKGSRESGGFRQVHMEFIKYLEGNPVIALRISLSV